MKQKLFGFLNLILMLAATTAPQLTQLRLPPKARLSCRLASSTCGKTQRQEIHRRPEAAIEPILSPPLRPTAALL